MNLLLQLEKTNAERKTCTRMMCGLLLPLSSIVNADDDDEENKKQNTTVTTSILYYK